MARRPASSRGWEVRNKCLEQSPLADWVEEVVCCLREESRESEGRRSADKR